MAKHSERITTTTRAFVSLAKDRRLKAIAFSGPWGTGKTYLINEFVKTHAGVLKESGRQFAYVSLFGLQSLSEVRAKLAAAAITTEKSAFAAIGKKAVLKGLIPSGVGGFDLSSVGDIAKEFIEGAVLKKLFICIDDLERVGAGLRPVDVLGLIAELTEQRDCKVLLILNKEKLPDSASLRIREEKVFDLTLDYHPKPSDVVQLAIEKTADQDAALPVFERFCSANIRVMRRLAWVLDELKKVDTDGLDFIWPQVVRQAAILTLLKFERGLDRQAFDQILRRDEAAILLRQMEKRENEEAVPQDELADFLDELDHATQAYDKSIVELLHDGSCEKAVLGNAFETAVSGYRFATLNQRADTIMQSLRSGLQTTAVELSAQIREFLGENLTTVHRSTVAVLCDLLLAIDKTPEAEAIVRKLMTPVFESVHPSKRASHLDGFPALLASGIIQAIPFVEAAAGESLEGAFDSIAADPGSWDPEKLLIVKEHSDDEIRELFAGLRASDSMLRIRRFRERLVRGSQLSDEDRSNLVERIDGIIAELSEVDPLHEYKLKHMANPRPQN